MTSITRVATAGPPPTGFARGAFPATLVSPKLRPPEQGQGGVPLEALEALDPSWLGELPPGWIGLAAAAGLSAVLVWLGLGLARLRRALRLQREQFERSTQVFADALASRTGDLASLQQDHMRDLRESVSRQLEQVQRGVGEIQGLAGGLGELQRTLGNVKRRGAWGEAQLEQLLADFLTPAQYALQVAPRPGSLERVDAALILHSADGDAFQLPIDAKFPQEDYLRMLDARERGDPDEEARACRQLAARVRGEARRIATKYLAPPHTTDFAVLFIPTESLYAEILRIPGLLEQLHREQSVTLAGPANLGALLGAVRLGLRAVALHTRAGELWQQLGSLRSELDRLRIQVERARRHVGAAAKSLEQVDRHAGALHQQLERVEALPLCVETPLQRRAPAAD